MQDSSCWHQMSLYIRGSQNPGKDLAGYGAVGDVELAQPKHSASQASMLILIYQGAFAHLTLHKQPVAPTSIRAVISLCARRDLSCTSLLGLDFCSARSPRGMGKSEPGSLPPCSKDTSVSHCLPSALPVCLWHCWDVHP